MEKAEFWLEMNDGTEVYVRKWAAEQPRLVVQLVHGMVEHINRYDQFASFLTNQGITVYGCDYRGHGKTGVRQGHLGHLADNNGFEKIVADLQIVNEEIKQRHPDIPLILFSHSMGSFLATRFLQLSGEKIDGSILSGTGYHSQAATKIGILAAEIEIKRIGKRTPSQFFNTVVFGPYLRDVTLPKTKFDWLTRDQERVEAYMEDPLTGMMPSAAFFYDLFHGLNIIYDKKEIQKIPKDLPILIITGTNDPVGNNMAGVHRVMDTFYQSGVTNIKAHFYEEARHELLNELNKEVVYQDILHWVKPFMDNAEESPSSLSEEISIN